MRWTAKPKRYWKPWFAFLPLRDGDRMIWLEPIRARFAGDCIEWLPWEARPNDQPAE